VNLHASALEKKPESRRNAGFFATLLLSGRSFQIDNVSRERKALATFRLAAHTCINIARTFMPGARRFTQFLFADGIADADYHRFDG
jgi:hypothetical protein